MILEELTLPKDWYKIQISKFHINHLTFFFRLKELSLYKCKRINLFDDSSLSYALNSFYLCTHNTFLLLLPNSKLYILYRERC